jgi:very-short-patch-repair endonuclease
MNKLEISSLNKDVLEQLYVKELKSDVEIAEIIGTYSNKIRRLRHKLGIPTRTPTEAQQLALKIGRAKHPTLGKKRTDGEKKIIGEKVSAKWAKIDDVERQRRSDIGKQSWENKTQDEKELFLRKASESIRKSSKEGSALEKFLLAGLIKDGYKVDYHKERLIPNGKLQIDMILPEYNIAIEVDGPSHIRPVWGQENFERNKRSDEQKTGLLLGLGFTLIRLRQNGCLSNVRKNKFLAELLQTVKAAVDKTTQERYIIIGDKT